MAGRTLSVRLLGGFAVTLDGVAVPSSAWRQRRAAALVKMLALAPGHRLARDHLIDALWPALPVEAGASNLRKAAFHARRALGVDDGIVLRGGMVALLPEGRVETDVDGFLAAAQRALAEGDHAACRDAARLYAGDLLPEDSYEDWSAAARAGVRQRYLDVLAGAQMWEEVLALDPVDERAHRAVIRDHLRDGDRAAAIRAFDRLRVVLREELGVSPDPASVALDEQVLAAEGRDVPSPAERARALLAWGVVHWERSDLAEAEGAAGEARALAIDAGLGRELADASELLALVAYAQGRWRELFAATFVDALERSPRLTPFVFDANMCMSEFALDEVDGLHATAALAGELLAVAERTGSEQARALGLLLRGESALLAGGDPARVRHDLAEAARLHQATDSTTGWALATERLAQAEAAGGDPAAADRLHREALALAQASSVPAHLLLFVYGGMLEGADLGAAAAIVAEGEAASAGLRACEPCSMAFRVRATMACAEGGDTARARAHFAEAERIARMWPAGPWHAAVAEARAALRLAEGAPLGEAEALLTRAAEGFAAAGRSRDAGRCRAAAAALG